ncbi:MAG: glycosyl hydrolase [Leeuwenhoekiella sp.]
MNTKLKKKIGLLKLLCLVVFCFGQLTSHGQEPLQSGFVTPHEDNNLWCYWYWINDDISKSGITKDLEAMKKAGIGGALIGNINPAKTDGKVPMLSEEWWSHMVHAVNEGHRIGVDIGIFNCPGWSQSGGPWIDAEKAMRYLTYNEIKVNGGQMVKAQISQPESNFQDTHTLAFRTAPIEEKSTQFIPTKVSANWDDVDTMALIDGITDSKTSFKPKPDESLKLNFELSEPITARTISMTPSQSFNCDCKLSATVDGEEKLIQELPFKRYKTSPNVGPIRMGAYVRALPDVKSKYFTLTCSNFSSRNEEYGFAEINISEAPLLDKYIEKQLGKMHPTSRPKWDSYIFDSQQQPDAKNYSLNYDEVLDISSKIDKGGNISWKAPEGEWTIMRIGMSPTGTKNSPAAPQGVGYEVDKMNSEFVKFHFENFVGEFLKRIPEESKPAFKYVIGDSYEMGSQNWTDNYEAKFKKKYGYDPVRFLPVLSGRIVGSIEESERFLWDLRRGIADDVAYEYVGTMRKASNEHNLQTWLENYGHWGFPGEFMMYGGQSDLIAGEFWNEGSLGNIECKASSSTSHTYGKPLTSAEAFTSARKTFLRHPAMLKKRGDWSLTEGINHFVLHLYIQQPDDNRKPGMNAWFGTEFNRHNTWFDQADTYFDYLRRCQHLLQKGKYVADVCYFIGENTPIMTGGRVPEIPKGYSYDYINAEVILDRLSVKDGRFVLPDGMSYKVMVLPPFDTMRPELIAKIEDLVEQGGIVLGPKPEKSPSLQNYPECDEQVKATANKLWKGPYQNGKLISNYGKGKILDGYRLSEVFDIVGLTKDFDVPDSAPVLWTHRKTAVEDIYFITNQSDTSIDIAPIFRVEKNRMPQLWDAVTGEIRTLSEYKFTATGTEVPLKLEPSQSWFVIFGNKTPKTINTGYVTNFPDFEEVKLIDEDFKLNFLNKEIGPKDTVLLDKLIDWTSAEDDDIKYYSGTAVYTTDFTMGKIEPGKDHFLNLGKLSVMAKVKLNGKELGGVWIAPYRLNVTDALIEGTNVLEIEVVNLWRNQLIKDKTRDEDNKYTWLVTDDIEPSSEIVPSGLLGPVVIEAINK